MVSERRVMHGFTWTDARRLYHSFDDPQGMGTTTINGVNNAGDLVGFYVDATGNTDGAGHGALCGGTTVRSAYRCL